MAKKLTTEQFISRGRELHGDQYDYSLVEYVDQLTPVKIICCEHGEFEQPPKAHLIGSGCRPCGYKKAAKLKRSRMQPQRPAASERNIKEKNTGRVKTRSFDKRPISGLRIPTE